MLKQTKKGIKMASLFQRILFTPIQCKVLDFIKDNPDSVKYYKSCETDRSDRIIGMRHHVGIDTTTMSLNAELIKYKNPNRDPYASYTFTCKENTCKNKTCALRGEPFFECSYGNGFATQVYTRMLNNYVAKNGCPCR